MISKVNRSKRFKSIEIKIHSARDIKIIKIILKKKKKKRSRQRRACASERARERERASASESRQHATLSFWKKLLCRVAATNL